MGENGMSPADFAAVAGNGGLNGSGEWFGLIILYAMMNGGFGWNNGRFANDGVVTEADLCNANSFNELKGSVGRLSDQVGGVNTNLSNGLCNLGYETLRNFNSTQMLIAQGDNATQRQLSECCCKNERIALENRYIGQQNTAAINANTTAAMQRILDQMCADKAERQAQRINQLELQQALCGVVRYPNMMTYNAGFSPFCNNYNNNSCCGYNNI